MPLHPDQLDDHISRRGPFMWHVTTADALDAIRDEGVRPGSERGFSSKGGFFKTRAGRVYVCDLPPVAVVEVSGVRAYLQVDLRKLDPTLIDPDEDLVQDSFIKPGKPWVTEAPPKAPVDTDPEEVGQALAEWADNTDGFDASEVTAKSLDAGRIAYHGTIPADAVTVIPLLSEGAHFFRTGVEAALASQNLGLAAVPQLGFYKTEVERAIALAKSLIVSSVSSVGQASEDLHLEWPYPEYALSTRDVLSRLERGHRRNDKTSEAELLHVAKHLAEAVAKLEPELGWSGPRDVCINIASTGVDSVKLLNEFGSFEQASTAARDALEALVAVPDQH